MKSMDFKQKRWISLFAGFCIEALAGVAYAYSVFQTPLIEKFGWSVSGVSLGFTINAVMAMLVSILFGAKLKQKLKTRTEVFIGAFLYGGGIILLRFIQGSVFELYLYFSVISSFGCTMVYPVLTAYALELFPERTGFAGGLMTAGYGLGAVIWAPLATAITEKTGNIGNAFLFMGLFFMIGIALLSRLLYTPPEGFRDEMLSGAAALQADKPVKANRGKVYEVGKSQMLKLPMFYLMMISLIIALACGGMIINQGSPIMQLQFGMTATAAAVIVSLLAVANTIGRLIWGAISDKIGKAKTLVFVHILMAVVMVLLLLIKDQTLFTVVLLGTTFCYGGAACLVAPTTEELFGGKNISANYSVSFSVFGVSGLLGPLIISNIRQSTGTYTLSFLVGAVLSVAALLVTFLMLARAKAVRSQNHE